MWYLAEILLAAELPYNGDLYQCEACNVVFLAPDAAAAHRKAVAWGNAYAAEPPASMQFLGVSHLTTVDEEFGDETEVCGRFFEASSVWDQVVGLVPPPDRLAAVRWEMARDVPLGELLGSDGVARLKRVMNDVPSAEFRVDAAHDLPPEYDFDYSKARTNRFAASCPPGGRLVVLEPDIAQVFTDAASVNSVLRALIATMPPTAAH